MPSHNIMPHSLQLTLSKNLSKLSKYELLFEPPKLRVFIDKIIQLASRRKIHNFKQVLVESFTFSQHETLFLFLNNIFQGEIQKIGKCSFQMEPGLNLSKNYMKNHSMFHLINRL